MKCVCKYDELRDLVSVDQFGFVDLQKMNATSTIDVEVAIQDERFNNIDDPRSIGERPTDDFELQQANYQIANYKAPDAEGAAS